jgi:hypothetical protein
MNLTTLQRTLLAVTRGDAPLEPSASDLAIPPHRLKIYRDFVQGHVTAILDKLYPVALSTLADPSPLIAEFLCTHPPRHRDLNLAGAPFPAFLDDRGLAFSASLAQLEWELFAAAVHPAIIWPPESGFALNPSISIFEQFYPAVQFMVDHPEPAHPPVDRHHPARLDAPQVALVYRRETHAVAFRVLDAPTARALAALANDTVPDDADLDHTTALGIILRRSAIP